MNQPDDDAAWRDIVEHYGERPAIDDESATAPPDDPPPPPTPTPEVEAGRPAAEERFVPEPPPPLPRTTPDRLVAWLGVLVAPLLLLVLTLLRVSVPGIVTFLLVAGFVAGFGYLVATMSTEPRDPGDDGARL